MLIGYARVSTHDQNLELQTEALTKAGCKKIFEDKISGSRAERPGLAKAQEALREGDTLVVWKLDRLGRSVKHLVNLVGELHKQGVQFKSLTDAIDAGTASEALLQQSGPDRGARDVALRQTSSRLEVQRFTEDGDSFCERTGTDAEGAFDNARFTADVLGEVEGGRLTLT